MGDVDQSGFRRHTENNSLHRAYEPIPRPKIGGQSNDGHEKFTRAYPELIGVAI
jgi:hypothetical protein